MASPFPGMDPYLEHPEIWPGLHLLLIAALAESLAPQLRPKYSVSVEVRMYETTGEQSLLVGIPDVAIQKSQKQQNNQPVNVAVASPTSQPVLVQVPMPITVRQGYLEVREVSTKEVVTAIELLSPINKRSGRGRQTYVTQRERVLSSSTNLVEIDLLRAHEPMPVFGDDLPSHYRILVSRSQIRPQAELYKFNVTDPLPAFRLPLRPDDQAPTINLQKLLDEIYDRSGYDLKLDYQQEPVPELSDAEATWLDQLLSEKGLRPIA
ncbi:DUF4058 family protein [Leptothoe spongobia]|uniref:DUF4058 family protein n=1 Tax=Leptothoe spongobia TAU-MAC 1115 TaxID=1967444 RepID=A0A947GKE9_9CYAN|nr:DUF4058 family protein [Leptothoe spongobia]MBT9317755.1 DUF4058 family protein [Leptothoe spongobia TAU-MAC 1115]